MPKIGVMVPVYNVEAYLPRCIDSILAQSYQDFDLLLVNDGSSDKSGEICDAYALKDKRINVIHQENQGVACARNAALDWAFQIDCQWVAFVDSDDTIAPDYLEKLLGLAQTQKAQIVSCKIMACSSQMTSAATEPVSVKISVISGQKACEEVYKIDGMTVVSCPGKLIHKSLFSDIRFPEGKIHEDEAIIPQVMYRAQRIALTTEPLYFYFQSDNSVMRSTFHIKRFEALEAMDACISFFRTKGETGIVDAAIRRRTIMHSLSVLLAKQNGFLHQVSDAYRISVLQALRQMQQCTSYDEFTWHLNKFYPRLVKPYSYTRKMYSVFKRKK